MKCYLLNKQLPCNRHELINPYMKDHHREDKYVVFTMCASRNNSSPQPRLHGRTESRSLCLWSRTTLRCAKGGKKKREKDGHVIRVTISPECSMFFFFKCNLFPDSNVASVPLLLDVWATLNFHWKNVLTVKKQNQWFCKNGLMCRCIFISMKHSSLMQHWWQIVILNWMYCF